jgi:hypothetical protein
MLLKTWRNEIKELENIDSEKIYTENQEAIELNSQKYIKIDIDLSKITEQIENLRASEEIDDDSSAHIECQES